MNDRPAHFGDPGRHRCTLVGAAPLETLAALWRCPLAQLPHWGGPFHWEGSYVLRGFLRLFPHGSFCSRWRKGRPQIAKPVGASSSDGGCVATENAQPAAPFCELVPIATFNRARLGNFRACAVKSDAAKSSAASVSSGHVAV